MDFVPDSYVKITSRARLDRGTYTKAVILQPGDVLYCTAVSEYAVRVRAGRYVGDIFKKHLRPLTPLECMAYVA